MSCRLTGLYQFTILYYYVSMFLFTIEYNIGEKRTELLYWMFNVIIVQQEVKSLYIIWQNTSSRVV